MGVKNTSVTSSTTIAAGIFYNSSLKSPVGSWNQPGPPNDGWSQNNCAPFQGDASLKGWMDEHEMVYGGLNGLFR